MTAIAKEIPESRDLNGSRSYEEDNGNDSLIFVPETQIGGLTSSSDSGGEDAANHSSDCDIIRDSQLLNEEEASSFFSTASSGMDTSAVVRALSKNEALKSFCNKTGSDIPRDSPISKADSTRQNSCQNGKEITKSEKTENTDTNKAHKVSNEVGPDAAKPSDSSGYVAGCTSSVSSTSTCSSTSSNFSLDSLISRTVMKGTGVTKPHDIKKFTRGFGESKLPIPIVKLVPLPQEAMKKLTSSGIVSRPTARAVVHLTRLPEALIPKNQPVTSSPIKNGIEKSAELKASTPSNSKACDQHPFGAVSSDDSVFESSQAVCSNNNDSNEDDNDCTFVVHCDNQTAKSNGNSSTSPSLASGPAGLDMTYLCQTPNESKEGSNDIPAITPRILNETFVQDDKHLAKSTRKNTPGMVHHRPVVRFPSNNKNKNVVEKIGDSTFTVSPLSIPEVEDPVCTENHKEEKISSIKMEIEELSVNVKSSCESDTNIHDVASTDINALTDTSAIGSSVFENSLNTSQILPTPTDEVKFVEVSKEYNKVEKAETSNDSLNREESDKDIVSNTSKEDEGLKDISVEEPKRKDSLMNGSISILAGEITHYLDDTDNGEQDIANFSRSQNTTEGNDTKTPDHQKSIFNNGMVVNSTDTDPSANDSQLSQISKDESQVKEISAEEAQTPTATPTRKKKFPIPYSELPKNKKFPAREEKKKSYSSSSSDDEIYNVPLKERQKKKKARNAPPNRIKETKADRELLSEMIDPKPSTSAPLRRELERNKKALLGKSTDAELDETKKKVKQTSGRSVRVVALARSRDRSPASDRKEGNNNKRPKMTLPRPKRLPKESKPEDEDIVESELNSTLPESTDETSFVESTDETHTHESTEKILVTESTEKTAADIKVPKESDTVVVSNIESGDTEVELAATRVPIDDKRKQKPATKRKAERADPLNKIPEVPLKQTKEEVSSETNLDNEDVNREQKSPSEEPIKTEEQAVLEPNKNKTIPTTTKVSANKVNKLQLKQTNGNNGTKEVEKLEPVTIKVEKKKTQENVEDKDKLTTKIHKNNKTVPASQSDTQKSEVKNTASDDVNGDQEPTLSTNISKDIEDDDQKQTNEFHEVIEPNCPTLIINVASKTNSKRKKEELTGKAPEGGKIIQPAGEGSRKKAKTADNNQQLETLETTAVADNKKVRPRKLKKMDQITMSTVTQGKNGYVTVAMKADNTADVTSSVGDKSRKKKLEISQANGTGLSDSENEVIAVVPTKKSKPTVAVVAPKQNTNQAIAQTERVTRSRAKKLDANVKVSNTIVKDHVKSEKAQKTPVDFDSSSDNITDLPVAFSKVKNTRAPLKVKEKVQKKPVESDSSSDNIADPPVISSKAKNSKAPLKTKEKAQEKHVNIDSSSDNIPDPPVISSKATNTKAPLKVKDKVQTKPVHIDSSSDNIPDPPVISSKAKNTKAPLKVKEKVQKKPVDIDSSSDNIPDPPVTSYKAKNTKGPLKVKDKVHIKPVDIDSSSDNIPAPPVNTSKAKNTKAPLKVKGKSKAKTAATKNIVEVNGTDSGHDQSNENDEGASASNNKPLTKGKEKETKSNQKRVGGKLLGKLTVSKKMKEADSTESDAEPTTDDEQDKGEIFVAPKSKAQSKKTLINGTCLSSTANKKTTVVKSQNSVAKSTLDPQLNTAAATDETEGVRRSKRPKKIRVGDGEWLY